MRYLIIIYILMAFLLSRTSCKGDKTKESVNENDTSDIINAEASIPENISDLKPGEMMFLVEGAVDSWFFYHLHDYLSYEPIIRSTNYNADEDVYIHKCRYRASTLEGGYETEEKIFKVTLQVDSSGLKDFNVEDITGHKSPTEKVD